MILALDEAERGVLLAQLLRERYVRRIPDPIPTSEPSSVTARRRRELGFALDGYFIDDRPGRIGDAA